MSNYINFYDEHGHYSGYATESDPLSSVTNAPIWVHIIFFSLPFLFFFVVLPAGLGLLEFIVNYCL